MTGLFDSPFCLFENAPRIALAQRPVDVARLAEAAALHAAAHHLQARPVVDDLHRRHDVGFLERYAVQVAQDLFLHARVPRAQRTNLRELRPSRA